MVQARPIGAATCRGERLPVALLAVVAAVTGPLLLLHYGSYHWFRGDEWFFLSVPDPSAMPDLLEPHTGAHLVIVPRLVYYCLWQVVGLTAYWPYQVVVVVIHMAIGCLLFVVMRRSGVRPWLAAAPAILFLLVGPGAKNAVWAFQMGFNGSLAWGLAHLILTDHDGRFSRRDALGLLCGLLAISSSGVGATLTVAVVLAVLIRRGWRLALLHATPLLVLGTWAILADAGPSGEAGWPTPSFVVSWVESSLLGTLLALGRFEAVAWALAATTALGVAVGRTRLRDDWRRLSMPIGLAVSSGFFMVTTALGRSVLGPAGARGDRYMYLEAALLLPAIVVSLEWVARRWTWSTAPLVALLLAPVPFNLTGFDPGVYDAEWMRKQERVVTTAVRMPFAKDVPPDVIPTPDARTNGAPTIGFLLTALAAGDLEPSTGSLPPDTVNELRVRLGVAQREGSPPEGTCRTFDRSITISPAEGDVLYLGSNVAIATSDGHRRTSAVVRFEPMRHGRQLTFELPGLHLLIGRAGMAEGFTLCGVSGSPDDNGWFAPSAP